MNRPRLLLADDNRLLTERVAQLLSTRFRVVDIALNGQELVDKALDLMPDVIVVDIAMPILSGIDAVQRLRKAGLAARVVFLTIHSEAEFVEACLAAGAIGYVAKSRMGTDLIPAIHSAIAGNLFVSPSLSPEQAGR